MTRITPDPYVRALQWCRRRIKEYVNEARLNKAEQAPKFAFNQPVRVSGYTHPPLRVYKTDKSDPENITYVLAEIKQGGTEENAAPVLWRDGIKVPQGELIDARNNNRVANL